MNDILNKLIKPIFALTDPGGGSSGGPGPVVPISAQLPNDSVSTKFPSLSNVIGELLPFVYVVAGLILMLMLVNGGIALMTSAGNPDKTKAGYGKITGALIGFFIIFLSWFVAKIVEVIFGVSFM